MTQTHPTPQTTLHFRELVDTYWASFLGCTTATLHTYGDALIRHKSSDGIFCLDVGDSRIISVAPDVLITPPYGPISREWIYTTLMSAGTVQEVYGPGDLFYCTHDSFIPADDSLCRPLADAEDTTLADFSNQVEWHCMLHNPVNLWNHAFGIYDDGKLVSAATTIVWGDMIAAIKVATLPGYQGRGYGRAVTSAATRTILNETHFIPQYDTAASNRPSQQIARALGYEHYGRIYYGTLK